MTNIKSNSFVIQCCKKTYLKYGEVSYEIFYKDPLLKISLDEDNYLEINQKNQQVPYKANILGGFALSKKKKGSINHEQHFRILWDEETLSMPVLIFNTIPDKIIREYWKGGNLELGIENEKDYWIEYNDGIKAEYILQENGVYKFSFSTGFHGLIKKEDDGSHTINFKGDIIDHDIDGYTATSKFVISRSKYTNNLVLYFQDDAEVIISLL